MTGPVRDLEGDGRVSVILMGSFQFSKEANDIDLILVYENISFTTLTAIKRLIAQKLLEEFDLLTHYTTLSKREYREMKQLHEEKHLMIFDALN